MAGKITPEKFREEEQRLADEYFADDSLTMGLYEYALENASKEYAKWLRAYSKRVDEAEKRGVTIN